MTNSYQFCKKHDISGQRRTSTITKASAGLYTNGQKPLKLILQNVLSQIFGRVLNKSLKVSH